MLPNSLTYSFLKAELFPIHNTVGHLTVVYLVAKPLIWSEAEGDLVVIKNSI